MKPMSLNHKPTQAFKQWLTALRAFAQIFAKSYLLPGNAKRATRTFMGWSGPQSIQKAHRDSDLRSGPPAVDARLASLIGIPLSHRGGAGRDWAGGAPPTGRTTIIPSKNARTWDLDGAGPTRGRVRSPCL